MLRPALYDWGMLKQADFLLRQLLDTLAPALSRGVPIVGLEPACIAAFRDEVPALFPDDDRARRLKDQSVLVSEFLDRHCRDFDLPKLPVGRKALVQIHCHEHAVLDPQAERHVLERIGIDGEVMPSGCCGMAGSFGFEAEKYHWSKKIAELGVLSRLGGAPSDAIVLANGFSCREQIEQLGGRQTWHIAELVAEALGFSVPAREEAADGKAVLVAGGMLAAGALLGAVALYRGRAAARGAHSSAARNPTTPPAAAANSPRWRMRSNSRLPFLASASKRP